MRRAAAIFAFALCFTLAAAAASAHAFLDSAAPGAGARMREPPAALMLSFTEPVEGADVGVQVFDATGALVASNKDSKTVVNWATITLHLPRLRPGTYRVAWHVDLGRGHATEGSYRFTVLGPEP